MSAEAAEVVEGLREALGKRAELLAKGAEAMARGLGPRHVRRGLALAKFVAEGAAEDLDKLSKLRGDVLRASKASLHEVARFLRGEVGGEELLEAVQGHLYPVAAKVVGTEQLFPVFWKLLAWVFAVIVCLILLFLPIPGSRLLAVIIFVIATVLTILDIVRNIRGRLG